MLHFSNATGLSRILASVSLAIILPQAGLAVSQDTLPRANPFSPARILTDSSLLGRWEINSQDPGIQEDSLNRGRNVIHFYPDHRFEAHSWSMITHSAGTVPEYNGSRISGKWFVRDTLLGMIMEDCEGLNVNGERECGFLESKEDSGHDTDWSVVKLREGERYLVDAEMAGMLAWRYRGAERDITPPSFWTAAAQVRPRADGFQRKPGSTSLASIYGVPESYDLLGRRPAALPAVTRRFFKPDSGPRGRSDGSY